MKLTKLERKKQNENLDLFLSFAPKLITKLKKGQETNLTDAERALFLVVHNFLEHNFLNRRITGVPVNAAKIERAQEMYKRHKSIQQIEEALKISTATVYRYLEAEQVAEKKAREKEEYLEQIKIFQRLSENDSVGEITKENIEQLKSGMEIVRGIREVAKKRNASLVKGRRILEELRK